MTTRWPLAAALVASLAIHLAAGVLIVSPWFHARPNADSQAAIEPMLAITPTIPRLGIERSKAVTVTWVGFETPSEHQAQDSEVEQAALSPAPGLAQLAASDPAPPTPTPQPAPPVQQPQPAEAQPSPTPAQPSRPSIPMDAFAPVAITPPTPVVAASVQPDPAPTPADEPKPQLEEATAPTAPATPSQVATGRPGIEDQRESDASALEKPLKYTPGKPIAAEGIEITTVRPDFGTTARMLANPQDPLVVIDFKSDGHVHRARFARSGIRVLSTGNPYVDGAILDAIYRWTAKGDAIDELPEGQTLTYSVQLLLHG